MRKGSGGCF